MTGYGEATVEILPSLVAAGGVRLSHARLGGSGEDVPFAVALAGRTVPAHRPETDLPPPVSDRKSAVEGKSVSVRVIPGGARSSHNKHYETTSGMLIINR